MTTSSILERLHSNVNFLIDPVIARMSQEFTQFRVSFTNISTPHQYMVCVYPTWNFSIVYPMTSLSALDTTVAIIPTGNIITCRICDQCTYEESAVNNTTGTAQVTSALSMHGVISWGETVASIAPMSSRGGVARLLTPYYSHVNPPLARNTSDGYFYVNLPSMQSTLISSQDWGRIDPLLYINTFQETRLVIPNPGGAHKEYIGDCHMSAINLESTTAFTILSGLKNTATNILEADLTRSYIIHIWANHAGARNAWTYSTSRAFYPFNTLPTLRGTEMEGPLVKGAEGLFNITFTCGYPGMFCLYLVLFKTRTGVGSVSAFQVSFPTGYVVGTATTPSFPINMPGVGVKRFLAGSTSLSIPFSIDYKSSGGGPLSPGFSLNACPLDVNGNVSPLMDLVVTKISCNVRLRVVHEQSSPMALLGVTPVPPVAAASPVVTVEYHPMERSLTGFQKGIVVAGTPSRRRLSVDPKHVLAIELVIKRRFTRLC